MTVFPTMLAEPVPLVEVLTDGRGAAAVVALRAHGADAVVGLDPATVPLVAAASAEPGIAEFCPNDVARFVDVAAARRWVAKGRSFVAVTAPEAAAPVGSVAVRLLAYGWSGPEVNAHIPGADVTTAYRVTAAGQTFARQMRAAGAADFRLGLLLGELVVATAVVGGAAQEQVSLETWGSNVAARRVYADLGFVQPAGVAEVPAVRPTLQPVEPLQGGCVVDDVRCFYALRR